MEHPSQYSDCLAYKEQYWNTEAWSLEEQVQQLNFSPRRGLRNLQSPAQEMMSSGDESLQRFPCVDAASLDEQDAGSELQDPADPFSLQYRIPFPSPMTDYQMWMETSFMCRRNERERQRVRNVNDGFARLRNHLPPDEQRKRMSKVETLRQAIQYIKQLQRLLRTKKDN